MHIGYKLTTNFKHNLVLNNLFNNISKTQISEYKNRTKKPLMSWVADFIAKHKDLNFTPIEEITNRYMEQLNFDIFISHSHDDEELAIKLAIMIESTTTLKVFIDSLYWGNSRDILKELDAHYALNHKTNNYDYDIRNMTTAHTYLMLASSLTSIIDKTEIFLFLESDASTHLEKGKTRTYSPWIMHEIQISKIIKKKPSSNAGSRILKFKNESIVIGDSKPNLSYLLNTNHLNRINHNDLALWLDPDFKTIAKSITEYIGKYEKNSNTNLSIISLYSITGIYDYE